MLNCAEIPYKKKEPGWSHLKNHTVKSRILKIIKFAEQSSYSMQHIFVQIVPSFHIL